MEFGERFWPFVDETEGLEFTGFHYKHYILFRIPSNCSATSNSPIKIVWRQNTHKVKILILFCTNIHIHRIFNGVQPLNWIVIWNKIGISKEKKNQSTEIKMVFIKCNKKHRRWKQKFDGLMATTNLHIFSKQLEFCRKRKHNKKNRFGLFSPPHVIFYRSKIPH